MPRHITLTVLIMFAIAPLYACEPGKSHNTHNQSELIFEYVNLMKTERLENLFEKHPDLDRCVNSGHLELAIYRHLSALQFHKNDLECLTNTHKIIHLLIEHGANPRPRALNGQDCITFARNGLEDFTESFILKGCPELATEIETLWAAKQSRNN